MLEYLDEKDAELADEVRKLMFVFEDLLILDDQGDPAAPARRST